ncbi:hypothetical protein B566_EDAN010214 [Ephemera danica]|nr:hypothetical protein B566_EDAN010214 [Ephemera danica]
MAGVTTAINRIANTAFNGRFKSTWSTRVAAVTTRAIRKPPPPPTKAKSDIYEMRLWFHVHKEENCRRFNLIWYIEKDCIGAELLVISCAVRCGSAKSSAQLLPRRGATGGPNLVSLSFSPQCTLARRCMTMELEIDETMELTNDTFLTLNDSDLQWTSPTLPPELRFNNNALAAIIVYSALFVVAAVAIADMVVTFIMIPLEVGWRATTQWLAGNAACKVFVFLRAFGLYLSSMVLVCVSLDRYFAILHPLRVNDARRRGKVMLILAWLVSLLCSVPQLTFEISIRVSLMSFIYRKSTKQFGIPSLDLGSSSLHPGMCQDDMFTASGALQFRSSYTISVVFHVSRHPDYKDYVQCVTFGFFSSQTEETAYNLFCVLVMYFIPLLVICFAYTRILWEISKKSKETKDDWSREGRYQGRMRLRRSDMSNIERARARTLRMTVIIVLVFIWCWTPYVVMTLWPTRKYMFDRESATLVDGRVQDALFIMAVSNSCMNPLVYGTYAMNFKQEFRRCIECACLRRSKTPLRSNTGSLMERSMIVSHIWTYVALTG